MKKPLLLFLLLCSLLLGFPSADAPRGVRCTWAQINRLLPTSYIFFDLPLSDEELGLLQQVVVQKSVVFDQFGELENFIEGAADLIRDVGNEDEELIEKVSSILERIAQLVVTASEKEMGWVSLRASTPTARFDTPRWHTDGSYYRPTNIPQVKFATVLKGQGPSFIQWMKQVEIFTKST